MHRVRANFCRQSGQQLQRIAAQHQQAALQTLVQAPQRVMQPPAAGASHSPFATVDVIENINGQHFPEGGGRIQRWVVREPQVLTEPDDRRDADNELLRRLANAIEKYTPPTGSRITTRDYTTNR